MILSSCPCDRRRSLGWLTGLLALAAGPAPVQAADELMLPGNVGKSQSPAQAATARMGQAPAAGVLALAPLDGRQVARSTVGEVDMLAAAANQLVVDLDTLQAGIRRRSQEISALVADMDAKMSEYRQGLFCSGCGKTKSEILAKGETFPHPGRSILRPTAEQLRAKERELRRPIDSLSGMNRDDEQAAAGKLARRNEALDQIREGIAYWQTAFSFETQALQMQQVAAARQARAQRDEIEQLTRQLELDLAQHEARLQRAPADQRAALRQPVLDVQAQLKHWRSSLDQIDQAQQRRQRELDQQLQAARARSQEEAARLQQAVQREHLSRVLNLEVRAQAKSTYATADALGVKFRQGDFDPRRAGDVLAGVERFIGRFRGLSYIDAGVLPASGVAAPGSSMGRLLSVDTPPPPAPAVPNHLLTLPGQ